MRRREFIALLGSTAAVWPLRSVSETLTYYAFPDIHWQKISHQQSTRADHEENSSTHPCRGRVP